MGLIMPDHGWIDSTSDAKPFTITTLAWEHGILLWYSIDLTQDSPASLKHGCPRIRCPQ